jgi:hypothetical protein
MSVLVRRGERLRLEITNWESAITEAPMTHWYGQKVGTDTITTALCIHLTCAFMSALDQGADQHERHHSDCEYPLQHAALFSQRVWQAGQNALHVRLCGPVGLLRRYRRAGRRSNNRGAETQ